MTDPSDQAESAEAQPDRDAGEEFRVADTPGGLAGALEAVLMVVEEPIGSDALAAALRVPEDEVRARLRELAAEYSATNRGFELRATAAGWRFYSRHDYAPVVEAFLLDGQRARLSKAALETLAVVAYRQPVSRARIGAVRGVNVDGVVRTLLTRGLITEVGADTEHGAVLYGTTDYFLQRLGIGSLDELPPIAPYLPEAALVEELAERGGV